MSLETTAALTYQDLILTVAEQLGIAYYGANGDEAAQIPTDAYLLDKCKRYVRDGIRMFLSNTPPSGWRWQHPIADVVLWPEMGIAMPLISSGPTVSCVLVVGVPTVTATSAVFSATSVGKVLAVRDVGLFTIATYISPTSVTVGGTVAWSGSHSYIIADPTGAATVTGVYTSVTTVTASQSGTFYPSTVGKTLYVTDTGAVTLATYVSDTVMTLTGDHSWTGSKTFNLSSQGLYALPQTFSGEFNGPITYYAGSNRGVPMNWTSEAEIRRLRENWNSVSGNPYYAAIRHSTVTRKWEMYIYPNTGGTYTVQFPYTIYFDSITDLADSHPAGAAHDEAVKAACLAQAEMQGEDKLAGRMEYYRQIVLPDSWRIDARSAPRRLGYNGNPRALKVRLRDFREYFRRPEVTFRS